MRRRARFSGLVGAAAAGLVAVTLATAALAVGARAAEITPEVLPARIAEAAPQVLVLGEVHDNPAHHRHQAQAVAALSPRALVFEMLSPEQAARVTPDLIADPVRLAEVLEWSDSGWPDFAIYAPILAAAPQARIVGAALPRDQVRRAMSESLPAIFGPQAAGFGLDQPYAPDLQARLEAEAQADHCNALPPEMLPGMVAAQRLRDAAFARAALAALDETGGPVAVIVGTGHARADLAVPAMIRAARPELRLRTLGQLEAAPAEVLSPDQPFDWWIVTPPTARPDPCAAFQ